MLGWLGALGVCLAVGVGALAVRARRARPEGPPHMPEPSWEPDPEDPRVGTMVAGRRILRRLRGDPADPASVVYEVSGGTVRVLEPPVDPAAYEGRLRHAARLCPEMRGVSAVTADALVLAGPDHGPGSTGPWSTPEAFSVCAALVRLHADGMAHGGLAAQGVWFVPGRLILGPVAPEGSIQDDVAALRAGFPPEHAHLDGADARALALGLLRAERAGLALLRDIVRCGSCGEDAVLRGPPRVTMMDGFDADGRRVGGRSTERDRLCVGCGRFDVDVQLEGWR